MADRARAGRSDLPPAARSVPFSHQHHDESKQSPACNNEDILAPGYTSTHQSLQHHSSQSAQAISDDCGDEAFTQPPRESRSPAPEVDLDAIYRVVAWMKSGSAPNQLQDSDLAALRSAKSQPPINVATLSELDINRILNDPKLRHDLNFDRDVSFRPNYDGERGRVKKESAKQYWALLSVELALYMQVAVSQDPQILQTSPVSQAITWRLRDMFTSIRDILRTLVRLEDAETIEQMLDIDLLMQQLQNGVCDLIAFGEWLGIIIKGSCSPVRDAFVTSVVGHIKDAVMSCNPFALSNAIEQLFSVLETMKLDVANHQIRSLRLLMIAQTVPFSQHYFLQYQQKFPGFDARNAYKLFQDYRVSAARRSSNQPDGLQLIGRLTTDLLACYHWPLPVTFAAFDFDRIVEYQVVFRTHRARRCIIQTFTETASRLCGKRVTPYPEIISKLIQRVTQLDPAYSFMFSQPHYEPIEPPEAVVIEILRAAYSYAGRLHALPSDDDFELAEQDLSKRLNLQRTDGAEIQGQLKEELQGLVAQELETMRSMEELEMLNYCERATKNEATNHNVEMVTGRKIPQQIHGAVDSSTELGNQDTLSALAVKVAHVATLHWRVWGPILYSRDKCEFEDDADYEGMDEDQDVLVGEEFDNQAVDPPVPPPTHDEEYRDNKMR